jgi:hypothetical protein
MSYKEEKMEIVNKIGDEYFVICILGKADCEENKIFYKNNGWNVMMF